MKKVIFIFLFFPYFSISQIIDINKFGIGIQSNLPYINGVGISYKLAESQSVALFFGVPTFSTAPVHSGSYIEYNNKFNSRFGNDIIEFQPLWYALTGLNIIRDDRYVNGGGSMQCGHWLPAGQVLVRKTKVSLGFSVGVGTEVIYKEFDQLRLNLKIGLGINPVPGRTTDYDNQSNPQPYIHSSPGFDMTLINISSGIHYYFNR